MQLQSIAVITWSNIVRYYIDGTVSETEAEYQPDAGSAKDIPYLAVTGELWCQQVKDFWIGPNYGTTECGQHWLVKFPRN